MPRDRTTCNFRKIKVDWGRILRGSVKRTILKGHETGHNQSKKTLLTGLCTDPIRIVSRVSDLPFFLD